MLHKFYKFLLTHQVIFALFLIVIAWFIFQTREIIVSIFISYIIMAALMPAVAFLRKQGVSHFFSVLIPYLSVIVFLVLIIFPLIPFIVTQTKSLFTDLPQFINVAVTNLGLSIDAQTIQNAVASEFNNIGRNAISLTTKVFGGLFSTLTVLIVSFYLLLYHESFKRSVARLFHPNEQHHVMETLNKINEKLGAWLRGQLILCFVIGIMTWTALTLLGMPFAIPLAVIAGILEAVPTLGPILSSVPAIIVALTVSPSMALVIVATYILIQLLENNLLVPKIMQRAVGLNPVIVIIGIMVGANLMGVPGALLSIPFISFVIVLFKSINETAEK